MRSYIDIREVSDDQDVTSHTNADWPFTVNVKSRAHNLRPSTFDLRLYSDCALQAKKYFHHVSIGQWEVE